ncbi:hypothetical protein TNCV_1625281 [Trichonephila clavipes]|nr:hypothetical protein TNCV_1625281 [Trichonephila clavipes]
MWVAEWNEVVFTDESATPRWSDLSQETPWREDAEKLRYAPPHWSCTRYYGMGWYWGHYRTRLVRISDTFNTQRYICEVLEPVVLPYLQGLATAIFQRIMRDRTWHALFKGSSSIIRLNCFPDRLTLPILH